MAVLGTLPQCPLLTVRPLQTSLAATPFGDQPLAVSMCSEEAGALKSCPWGWELGFGGGPCSGLFFPQQLTHQPSVNSVAICIE